MHAKHDYNPVKTAYPIDSIPDFDEQDYPKSEKEANAAGSNASETTRPHTEDHKQKLEDLALLEKTQQSAFHQGEKQNAAAYDQQGYKPTSTELESKISWGLLIACLVLIVIGLIFVGTLVLISGSI